MNDGLVLDPSKLKNEDDKKIDTVYEFFGHNGLLKYPWTNTSIREKLENLLSTEAQLLLHLRCYVHKTSESTSHNQEVRKIKWKKWDTDLLDT